MEQKEIFKVTDETGAEIDAELLAAFEMDNKDYVIYSIDNTDNDMASIFAAELIKNEDGTSEIASVEDEETKAKITEIISEIVNK